LALAVLELPILDDEVHLRLLLFGYQIKTGMVVKYLKNYALYFFTPHIFNIFVKKWKQTKLKIQDYMKKTSLFIVAAFTMGLAACGNKTAQNAEKVDSAATQTSIVDSAFQKAAAGDYFSFDSKRVVTLQADGKVVTKGLDKDYISWELASKPQDSTANVTVDRKGMDNLVKDQGVLDLKEGKITIKDETYRKAKSKK
jgi:hypothetical protein